MGGAVTRAVALDQGELSGISGDLRGHKISTDTCTRLPAGWYTDPGESGGKRWWDGTNWTAHLKMPAAAVPKAAGMNTDPYGIGVVRPSTYDSTAAMSSRQGRDNRSAGGSSNRAALLSLLFGLLAAGFTIVTFLPGSSTYWVAGSGAIAILWGVIAIAHRAAGRATNIWAPVLGILLGGTATVLMLMCVAVLSLLSSATGGLLSPLPSAASAQVAAAPVSTEPFVFPANQELTADGSAVQQIATAINERYASGNPTLGAGQVWPASVTFTATTVLNPDGSVLAALPAGYHFGYSVSPEQHRYTVTVTGPNRYEIANYSSGTDRFSFTCPPTDTNCVPTR